MAYIRTIKSTFFTSYDIVTLSPLARLLYIALWTEADREGRLTWRPGNFKLRFLPGDRCDIDELCGELLKACLVVTYTIDGNSYAEIPTFKRHQVINNRERKSELPPRVNDATGTRHDASASREDATGTPLIGKERKGEEMSPTPPASPAEVSIRSVHRAVTLASVFRTTGGENDF